MLEGPLLNEMAIRDRGWAHSVNTSDAGLTAARRPC